jgi:hypothetical protein
VRRQNQGKTERQHGSAARREHHHSTRHGTDPFAATSNSRKVRGTLILSLTFRRKQQKLRQLAPKSCHPFLPAAKNKAFAPSSETVRFDESVLFAGPYGRECARN